MYKMIRLESLESVLQNFEFFFMIFVILGKKGSQKLQYEYFALQIFFRPTIIVQFSIKKTC